MRKLSVISHRGKADMHIVMLMRLLVALGTAMVLSVLAWAFGHYLDTGVAELATYQKAVAAVGIVIVGCAAFTEIFYGGWSARSEEQRIRRNLMARIFTTKVPPRKDKGTFDSARLITLMTDNTERVTEYRQAYAGATLAAILVPFLILLYETFFIDWVTGVILLVFCPLIPVSIGLFMSLFRGSSSASRKQRAELSSKYLDAIRNLVTIRLLGAGPRIENELKTEGEKNRWAIMKLLAGNQIVIIVLDGAFSLLLIFAAALLAVVRFHSGAINAGEALSIVFLSVLLLEPLLQVAGFFYIGMGGKASERAIRRYMEAKPLPGEIVEGEGDAHLHDNEVKAMQSPSDTHESAEHNTPSQSQSCAAIQAKNLSYDYGRGEVLRDVSFSVKSGQTLAIIGRSGGGKSTLMQILRGKLPLQGGSLIIDGKAVTTENFDEVRQRIAFVSQKTWLFTGTIRDNLELAQAGASDTEMWAALERANIADEVRRMPDGLDTDVGEQGTLISGGQAQRLSLARAFLSGRKLVYLDEPTSQVDIESERRLIKAIATMGSDYTVIVVTHRLALLKLADEIYELSDGVLHHRDDLQGEGNSDDAPEDEGDTTQVEVVVGNTIEGEVADIEGADNE